MHAVLNKHETNGAKNKSEMALFAQAFLFMLKVVDVVEDEPLTTTTKRTSSNLCQGFINARDSSDVARALRLCCYFHM